MSAITGRHVTNYQVNRPSLRAFLQAASRTLRLWRSRHRERHALTVIDERDLRDLRLSRWEIDRELAKPFWRG